MKIVVKGEKGFEVHQHPKLWRQLRHLIVRDIQVGEILQPTDGWGQTDEFVGVQIQAIEKGIVEERVGDGSKALAAEVERGPILTSTVIGTGGPLSLLAILGRSLTVGGPNRHAFVVMSLRQGVVMRRAGLSTILGQLKLLLPMLADLAHDGLGAGVRPIRQMTGGEMRGRISDAAGREAMLMPNDAMHLARMLLVWR